MANIVTSGGTILEQVSNSTQWRVRANGLNINEVYVNGTRIYRRFYINKFWEYLGPFSPGYYNYYVQGLFYGNTAQMINQLSNQYPPNNQGTGTVALVNDT
jgi:hypothetical protein